MNSHTNFSIGRHGDAIRMLDDAKTLAELKFWKQHAEYLEQELANIPDALREYGEWQIKDYDGVTTHVILDPKHHPTKDTPS